MDELKALEKTDKYLFHGSLTPDIQELTPRQAISFLKPDGRPAVFASQFVEPPIFMAVLGSRKLGGWGYEGLPGFGFYISEQDMTRAKIENWSGYVYILDRKPFEKSSEWEWRSGAIVKPLRAIKVEVNDLPTQIEIMPHDNYMAIARGRQ